ncbi:ComE operon protein 3 [Capnocytophaga canimorsus]|nr:ComEC/Rec2 family competence protein [Capnocytophaga canimorsus]CEN43697.1 ComE operon protein 3 [Capnocytophaga canimorsus]
MRFVNNAILLILIGFIIGILSSEWIFLSWQQLLIIGGILLLTIAFHLYLASRKLFFRQGYSLHVFFASIFVGFLTSFLHNPSQKSTHYIHHLKENEYYTFLGNIAEQVSVSEYGTTYRVHLFRADDQKISGDVLCIFRKENTLEKEVTQGKTIAFIGKTSKFATIKNPNQFDYKQYMQQRGIFWRVEPINFKFLETSSVHTIKNLAEKSRRFLSDKLDKTQFSNQSKALLKALLLGNRSTLDNSLYQSFIDSGTVHLLAISGLHVGVIVAILLFFIGKLPNRNGWKIIRFLLLLSGLWSFAFLTGLSASVMRAVTMFSFVGVGLLLQKQQGRFDALMLSMLFLLMIRPNFLFDVGFQLSYAAVFSILAFFPILNRIEFKNKLLAYFWKLFALGATAQLGVLPFSLYYFHQFPILFFVGNLFMVPLLFPILVLGFLSLFLATFNLLPNFLVFSLELLLNAMLFTAKTVASQEKFIFRDIYFDHYMLFCSVAIIFIFLIWLEVRKAKYLKILLCFVLVFQFTLFYAKYQAQTDQKTYVFHTPKNTLIGVRNGKQLTVYQKHKNSEKSISAYIKNSGVNRVNSKSIPSLLEIQKHRLLIIDSLGVYPKSDKVDFVLLSNSPKINLERMLRATNPTWVIADGSNFPWLASNWERTCKKLNIQFHNTSKSGSFLID